MDARLDSRSIYRLRRTVVLVLLNNTMYVVFLWQRINRRDLITTSGGLLFRRCETCYD
jgi:hypothetical protein